MRKNIFLAFFTCLLLPAAGCAGTYHNKPQKLNPEGYNTTFSRSGDSYITGQPGAAAIKEIKELGITAVISLRTPGEMADENEVPFDEAAEVATLGLEYIPIPMNGRSGYTEDMLNKFMSAYDKHEGKVLLHCRSGVRASQMWTAFLVKHEGMSLEEARKIGEQINLNGAPMNGLLGGQ